MIIHEGIQNNEFNIDSILMIGQSNMAGRGEFNEVSPILNPRCFMLRNGRWQTMSEPINPDRAIFGIEFHSGISLAASFADEYEKHFNSEIGLIPCADGGTKISQWQPGEILYDSAIFNAKLAMKTSNLKGIIWHQGESDCHTIQDVDAYSEKFINLFKSMILDLKADDIPIVIGELPQNISDKWNIKDRNKEFNRRLPSLISNFKNMCLVSSKGLSLKNDGIHFNSVSCREFGRRYFDAYYSVVSR